LNIEIIHEVDWVTFWPQAAQSSARLAARKAEQRQRAQVAQAAQADAGLRGDVWG